MNIEKHDDVYEKCIICGQTTKVKKSTDVNERTYYIKGCGQLCKDCYIETYHHANHTN